MLRKLLTRNQKIIQERLIDEPNKDWINLKKNMESSGQ